MSENILAQFLRSEKDQRPYWETDHRGMVLPLIESGYNNSVSYGLPGILGGSAPSVLNDILQGRMVDKGEIEQGATDAAGAAMTGGLALGRRPQGAIPSGTARPAGHPSGSLAPTQQLAVRSEGGQPGHMASAASQPAQGSHTSLPNGQSLESSWPLQSYNLDPADVPQLRANLRAAFEAGQLPQDWYVHGRAKSEKLREDQVIQMTQRPDIAANYAGRDGSVWALRPSDAGRTFDFTSPNTPDVRRTAADLLRDNRSGMGPNIEVGNGVRASEPIRQGFAPQSIVDSAGWFDDPSMMRWLDDKTGGGGFFHTPDGAVASHPDWTQAVRLYANAPTSAAAPSLRHIAQTAAREQAPGIRAYHGSPHDFDKFDLSKIGTGEGAQAYGHGLYFAENEGVAKQYRDTLSAPVGNDIANIMIKQHNGDVQKAIADLKARPGFDVSHSMQEAVRRLETGDKSTSSGRMYEVNIKADPEHFLDWDKPLSQQSGAVKGFIDSRLKDGPLRWDGTRARDAVTGEIVGRVLSSVKGGGFAVESPFANRKARFPTQQEALDHFNATFPTNYWDEIRNGKNGSYLAERLAAEGEGNSALRDNGIPGIKYLDQGSRGAGEGSRNYVVFSDKDIEIIRKYGMAAFLAMGGAAATQQPTNDGPRNVLAGPF